MRCVPLDELDFDTVQEGDCSRENQAFYRSYNGDLPDLRAKRSSARIWAKGLDVHYVIGLTVGLNPQSRDACMELVPPTYL